MPRKAFLLFFAGRDGAIGRKYSCAKNETRSVCLFFSGGGRLVKHGFFIFFEFLYSSGEPFLSAGTALFFPHSKREKLCLFCFRTSGQGEKPSAFLFERYICVPDTLRLTTKRNCVKRDVAKAKICAESRKSRNNGIITKYIRIIVAKICIDG